MRNTPLRGGVTDDDELDDIELRLELLITELELTTELDELLGTDELLGANELLGTDELLGAMLDELDELDEPGLTGPHGSGWASQVEKEIQLLLFS